MKLLFTTLKKTLFWSYERGSWQYDVMCVLILAFVFFAPNRFFHSADADKRPRVIIVTSDELGGAQASPETIRQYLSKTDGKEVEISSITPVTDNDSGKTEYLVYEK